MGSIGLISSVAFPLMMVIGAIAAWRISKRENRPEADKAAWRDDSLDDWRRERDLSTEEQRQAREAGAPAGGLSSGQEEAPETQRHQRIGG
ncbi:MAG: hypothetical protein HY875_08065 [Chloroflexi bacterium]|nr:hypothetical protein [Chloroflexota bacterium]